MPCEFGETLDEALCDWLVCGLRDKAYQKRLLSERELTLDKALQIAHSMETADVNARALRGSESGIHQGGARLAPPCKSQKGHQAPAPGQQGRECYQCGSTDHIATHCHFASFVYRKCQKKGHLARVRRSSRPASRQGTGKVNAKTHQLTSASENTEDKVPLLQLGKGHAAPITVDVTVNDLPWKSTPVQQSQLCHASNSESYSASPVTPITGGVAHLHCREGGCRGYFASSCGLRGTGA